MDRRLPGGCRPLIFVVRIAAPFGRAASIPSITAQSNPSLGKG
jgi:hypothetical protein